MISVPLPATARPGPRPPGPGLAAARARATPAAGKNLTRYRITVDNAANWMPHVVMHSVQMLRSANRPPARRPLPSHAPPARQPRKSWCGARRAVMPWQAAGLSWNAGGAPLSLACDPLVRSVIRAAINPAPYRTILSTCAPARRPSGRKRARTVRQDTRVAADMNESSLVPGAAGCCAAEDGSRARRNSRPGT
jgi:hypothetical protein